VIPLLLALQGTAEAGPVRFERVDLISESDGSWARDELSRAGQTPRFAAIRYLEQLTPVIRKDRLQLGLSLATQSVRWEQPLAGTHFGLNGGLQLDSGLPNGLLAGGFVHAGPLRIGVSASLTSGASWGRPVYDGWRLLPSLGIGIGRGPGPT